MCQLSSTSSNLTGHEKVSHFSISSSEGIKNPSTTSEISQVQSVVWIGQGTKAMDPQSQFIKLIPIVLWPVFQPMCCWKGNRYAHNSNEKQRQSDFGSGTSCFCHFLSVINRWKTKGIPRLGLTMTCDALSPLDQRPGYKHTTMIGAL